MSPKFLLGCIGLYIIAFVTLIACEAERGYNGLRATSYSGNIIVSTVATDPATGPGIVSMFDSTGALVGVLKDLYSSGEYATGLGLIGETLVYGVEGTDRLELMSLTNRAVTTITNVQLSSTPLHQVAIAADGSILIAETGDNTVEKFSTSGSRSGNPFIQTTVGSCDLSAPWGIATLSSGGVVVISSPGAAGRMSIYDSTGSSCVAHITAAPLNGGTPTAVAYHAATNKILVTFATTHAIYAFDPDGTNATQIYLNSTVINTPRALATGANGSIYVGSSGTDSVEKLSWNGTGTASRVGSIALIGPGLYTQNPTAIVVVP